MVHDLIQYVFSGLSVGCAYAAVALGLVIVANVTGVFNFATGDYVMVGGMIMAVTSAAHWSLVFASVASVAVVTGVAIAQERITVAPVRGKLGPLATAIVTVGVSIVLRGAVLELWGKDARVVPPYQGGFFRFLGVNLESQVKWVFLATAISMVLVTVLFTRTDIGRAMRACAINPIAARLTGIRLGTMSMLSFALAGALCGLLAAVAGSLTTIEWDSGINIGLVGFIAAALAGFTSPTRAVLAGLALGVVEAVGAGDISSAYVQAIVYAVLLVYLVGRDLTGQEGGISRLVKARRATEPGSVDAPEFRVQVRQRLQALERRVLQIEARARGAASDAHSETPPVARRGGRAAVRLATSLRSVRKRPMVLLPPALLVLAWFYPSTVSDLGTQDHAVALVTAAMAATGLGLVMGLAGQFSLGQAAFMLVSGYTAAILTADHHWDPLLALVVAVTASVLVGVIVGMLTLRLEGLNLALATLAVLVIAIVFVSNDAGLTHGTAGVQNIPGLTIFGSTINSSAAFFRLALVLLAAMLLIARNIWKSRIGRALKAIGIDQVAAESVGLTSDTLKLRIFVLGGAMAGVGGVLSAYYLRFVAPNSWDVGLTINLVTYLVVGGLFSPYGGAVGAALIGTLLYYIQQHVGASTSGGASSWDVVASGVLLIVSLLVFRRGLTAVPTLAAERISRWRGRATSKEGNGATGPRAANGTRLEPATRVPALDQITAPDPLKADTPVVVVEGLTKRFGEFTAVSELSFTLRPGYVTALIGPNGAGKSTVIDMLSGTLVASAGAVGIMGKPMAGLAPQQVARLGVARTFQTPRLFEGMTLLETVMIARDRHGGRFWLLDGALRTPWGIRSERLARDQALAWLAYVGLEDDAHRPATSLPVGKQRMAEVARALATEPSVLLLDEPAAGLDGTETLALADEIRALGDAGIAVLLVEHDMSMVMSIADRVIVLEQGKKIAEGPPEVVQSDQTVIDAYLGVVAA